MKIRVKFSKQGPVKFVGHLDIMRYFQKALRRAGVDVKYSEGFSPHQVMSFASPLGVGLTSNGEYMDIEVNGSVNTAELTKQINGAMVDGITVLNCTILDDSAKNAMSMVAAADYTLTFRDQFRPADWNIFVKTLSEFYAQKQILIVKKTKKSEKEMDIKPLIYDLHTKEETIFMKLSSGSSDNLKPDLVMNAYYQFQGLTCPEFAFLIQREEVYGNLGDETANQLVPLECMGEELE